MKSITRMRKKEFMEFLNETSKDINVETWIDVDGEEMLTINHKNSDDLLFIGITYGEWLVNKRHLN